MHQGVLSWKWAMQLYENIKLYFFVKVIVRVFHGKDNENIV
jgi:hypothetical protein